MVGYYILEGLYTCCESGKLHTAIYIKICGNFPHISKRITHYFGMYALAEDHTVESIDQKTFDQRWLALRNFCFQSVQTIATSLSIDQILQYPEFYESLCQYLSNWYLFGSSETCSFDGDESFFEEAVGTTAVSTKK